MLPHQARVSSASRLQTKERLRGHTWRPAGRWLCNPISWYGYAMEQYQNPMETTMKKIVRKEYIRYELSANNSIYVKTKNRGRQISASGDEAIELVTAILGETTQTDHNGCPRWFTP